jgi:hypothetical protein
LPNALGDLAGPRLETRLKQFAALEGLSAKIVVEA